MVERKIRKKKERETERQKERKVILGQDVLVTRKHSCSVWNLKTEKIHVAEKYFIIKGVKHIFQKRSVHNRQDDTSVAWEYSRLSLHSRNVSSGEVPEETAHISEIYFFTDTTAILNLLDLRSIMGCPRGHSLSIYARFSRRKRT